MTQPNRPTITIPTENPIKEIWSMLSYFESVSNDEDYLRKKFGTIDELNETKKALAFTIKAAKEYYTAAESVTLLTQPLLLFYGMTALSKVLFMATHGKVCPSTSHGLEFSESTSFRDYSTRVTTDGTGTFSMFHGCYSKEKLENMVFSIGELLSLIPEIKDNYETIYKQKSNAYKIERHSNYIHVKSDIELKKDEWEKFLKIPKLNERYPHGQIVMDGFALSLWPMNPEIEDPVVRAISGEEYLVLPLEKQKKIIALPEMSTHFIAMYILGMLSRYPLKQWLEIVTGEISGEVYIIQKLLEIIKRKFPNLILNELYNQSIIFTSPSV